VSLDERLAVFFGHHAVLSFLILQPFSQLVDRALVIAASSISFLSYFFCNDLTMAKETYTLFFVSLNALLLFAFELFFSFSVTHFKL
jgi:hypothetical protein